MGDLVPISDVLQRLGFKRSPAAPVTLGELRQARIAIERDVQALEREAELLTRDRWGTVRNCLSCFAELPKTKYGRPRKFCDDDCARDARAKRRRQS